MKTLGTLALGLLILAALPACKTAEKYAANNAAAKQWLAANAGKPAINVSGRWHAEDWGASRLTQTGNKITGNIAQYTATGVVKGRIVYLTLAEDGWVYYSVMAKLKPEGPLEGYYSREVPSSDSDE
jgi:hypothetical protein